MKEKMKVKVIGRDYKESFKDIIKEYTRVTKGFECGYEVGERVLGGGV